MEIKTYKTFIVDRKTWYRGNGSTVSALVIGPNRSSHLPKNSPDVTGCKCCVGFLCLSEGINEVDLVDRTTIGSLHDLAMPETLKKYNVGSDDPTEQLERNIMHKIYGVNDDLMTDRDREIKLKELFEKIGYDIQFIN